MTTTPGGAIRRLRWIALLAAIALSLATAVRAQTHVWPREPDDAAAPRPAPPPASIAPFIGEYGAAASSSDAATPLIVFERDGKLWRVAGVSTPAAVTSVRSMPADATAVEIDGVVYRRLQVGPEGGTAQLRVQPLRPVADVLKEARAATPPPESGTFARPELVELTSIAPAIKLDVRYATTNNFLGSVFYAQARAFLQRPAAQAVARVVQSLQPLGYGILVHDGYRPWFVTKAFWDATPPDKRWLVANPAEGSKHNRGAAVDLTLYDLRTGATIEMPSTYDESTQRAFAFYPGGTSLQRWHRALLRRHMEAEGFTVNPREWWHFDYRDWQQYAIGNVPFEQIK